MATRDDFPSRDLAEAAARMFELVDVGIDPPEGDASLRILQDALERGSDLFHELLGLPSPSAAIDRMAELDAEQLRLIALDRVFTEGPSGGSFEEFIRASDEIAAAAAAGQRRWRDGRDISLKKDVSEQRTRCREDGSRPS